jgi:hypothetical protein
MAGGTEVAASPAAYSPETPVRDIASTLIAHLVGFGQGCSEVAGQHGGLVESRLDQQGTDGEFSAAGEYGGPQFGARPVEAGDRPLVEAHSADGQLLALLVGQCAAVGQQRDFVAPGTQVQRSVHADRAARKNTHGAIADFPAVAERAVEDRMTPAFVHAGQRWVAVVHSWGQDHAPGSLTMAVAEGHIEASVVLLHTMGDLAPAQLD